MNLAELVQTIACIPNTLILSMSLSMPGFSSSSTLESHHSVKMSGLTAAEDVTNFEGFFSGSSLSSLGCNQDDR